MAVLNHPECLLACRAAFYTIATFAGMCGTLLVIAIVLSYVDKSQNK